MMAEEEEEEVTTTTTTTTEGPLENMAGPTRFYHENGKLPKFLMEVKEGESRSQRIFDVGNCSEELLRQQSYAIKNQLVESKAPRLFFMA